MKTKAKEKDIESDIVKYAKTRGVLSYKFVSPNTRGVPDRIFLFDGRAMFMEVKRAVGGVVSHQQETQIQFLNQAGCPAYVVSSVDAGTIFIDSFIDNYWPGCVPGK